MNATQAYAKHKNLKLAADELGMPWQTLYVQLRREGVSVTGDKAIHGCDRDRFASRAEAEFARLVPTAKNQNAAAWQSPIDFTVNGLGVDVKASNITKSRRWTFSTKKQSLTADFIVCFAYAGGEKYRVLVIPGEVARHYQTISVPLSFNNKWAEYEVSAMEIAAFFQALTP